MLRFAIPLFCLAGLACAAEPPPLLDEATIGALASELSGESAKRNLEVISGFHRMRASRGFHGAAEYIAARLREYGLADVEILEFPADGRTMFGTQKSRPVWDVDSAELWELRKVDDDWVRGLRVADWQSMPLSLAQDSESADVTADLIDVGAGTKEDDYAGKEIHGHLVLTSSQPEAVQRLAVDRFGAAGIVSYAQNQRTAWWGEDENLVRWGHLDSFSPTRTFGFMVTLKQARAWQSRLAADGEVRLEAHVAAQRHPGHYDIVTARIPGSDPARAAEEIAFSCHLDHPHPGANDNASGCATILEIARTYAKLIRERRLPAPARTLRFIWPPEIEGTTILLNARPDLAARIAAVLHLDMVGGGPATKAVFHVTRSPASLPTFVNDVAEAFAEFVNDRSLAYASGEAVDYPLVAPEGGKEALLAVPSDFSMGSDHEVYADSSFGIAAIYLNDWPDRYIHTNFDLPANIDPTKLKRAGFIAAASGWFLADLDAAATLPLAALMQRTQLQRTARMLARRNALAGDEAAALTRAHFVFEQGVIDSIERFAALPVGLRQEMEHRLEVLEEAYGGGLAAPAPSGTAAIVYRRSAAPKGPMSVFGYDYFTDHYGRERAAGLGLLTFEGTRGDGEAYAYEALNFVDGKRSVRAIRDALAAEFGPVPLELVGEYLAALAEIGVLRR